jgi:hypothetical protein
MLRDHAHLRESTNTADGMKGDATAALMMALDVEERLYFRLNQIEGKTQSKCAIELGWPMVKINRVRRRLNLHLAKLRGDFPPISTASESSALDGEGADIEKREGRFRVITPCRICPPNVYRYVGQGSKS